VRGSRSYRQPRLSINRDCSTTESNVAASTTSTWPLRLTRIRRDWCKLVPTPSTPGLCADTIYTASVHNNRPTSTTAARTVTVLITRILSRVTI
jgi:hypothetical protein